MPTTLDISYTDIAEVYLQELRRGNRVSVQSLAKQFPQHAGRILTEFPTMAALEGDLGGKDVPLPTIPNYRLLEEIGRGASGVVFKAKHDKGKTVAIKLVKFDKEYFNFDRLDREIDCLSRLRHPNVVTIETFGTTEDHVYIVTNFVEGNSLEELLSPKPSINARFWVSELNNDWNLLAKWGLEISTALDYIHQNKVIHRDIKPSNLLIDKNGKCWIIDFGLAKVNEAGMTITQSRQIAGTPRFMAPEQLRGQLDNRCDIYSLGRTLFELANHTIPSKDDSGITQNASQLNHALPEELSKIIYKASEPSAERRYQSAKELVQVFTRYLDGKSPCDRRRIGKRMTEAQFKASMRRRVRYAIAGGAACFLATTAILAAPKLLPKKEYNPASVINPTKQHNSLKKLANAIENEDSGFVHMIGEVMKNSVVNQSNDKGTAEEVASKIDQIVNKVATEGLKPGELDALIKDYRNSPLMNANKVAALHHPLHNSTLSPDVKFRGHTTLELFSKAIVNKRIHTEKADRVLAALFQGEIPKLEQIIGLRIPDETLVSWLRLVESSFGAELQSMVNEGSQSNEEMKIIIDNFLRQAN